MTGGILAFFFFLINKNLVGSASILHVPTGKVEDEQEAVCQDKRSAESGLNEM